MSLAKYKLEYQVGHVEITENNLLVEDIDDMIVLEEWETRLSLQLQQPYAVAYRKKAGKIYYSIFTDLGGKGSVFKCGTC